MLKKIMTIFRSASRGHRLSGFKTVPFFSMAAATLSLICSSQSHTAMAQQKNGLSPDCIKYMSYYTQDYKAKKYDDALLYWRKALAACPPTASQNMYIHGTTMYTKLYNKTTDAAARSAIVDTVLMLQDMRMEHFPAKRLSILNNKGGYIVNYRSKDSRFLYDNLGPIVTELGPQASETILVNYMKSAVDLYKAGDLSADALIETFATEDAVFESATSDQFEKARGVVESLFSESGAASCESLLSIYGPRFTQAPENTSLASTILRLLGSVDGCVDNDLYLKAATCVHESEPSYRSAYALYRMQMAKGNSAEALDYLEEASGFAVEGSEEQAKTTLELAQLAYKEGQRSKAYSAAKRVTAMAPAYAGKAWLLIGNLWSSSRPEKEVDKFAKLWAAADCYARAKAADDSLKVDADAQIASVSKYYPAAADMFMYELSAGQGYSISVEGMSAYTTVRTR